MLMTCEANQRIHSGQFLGHLGGETLDVWFFNALQAILALLSIHAITTRRRRGYVTCLRRRG